MGQYGRTNLALAGLLFISLVPNTMGSRSFSTCLHGDSIWSPSHNLVQTS